jgi:hypothetical protein
MMEGADDLMQEDRRIGIGGWLLAAAAAASVAAVLIASFATNAHAQAGAGGPIPNVVGSQYLSTPNNVADKQLVPIRVLPDGTVVVSSGGGGSGGTVTANQGTPAIVDNAWPVVLAPGAALAGANWTANRLEVTTTVQNASYVSGNSLGGLVTFTLPRTASGYLQSVGVQFIGGATTAVNAFCFDSNPTGSTFTDKSTFTIAAADEAKRINKTGYSLTPAAVVGDAVTGATVDNLAKPFVSAAAIYCAIVSTGTFTPATTTDMRVNITYVQSAQ